MENRTHADDAVLVNCPACGDYVVTDCDRVNLTSERQRVRWKAHQISALLRERSIGPLPNFWLQDGMEPYGPLELSENLAQISVDELSGRWPHSIEERLDRILCNLAHLSKCPGESIEVDLNDVTVLFAESIEEAFFYLKSLRNAALIQAEFYSSGCSVTVDVRGWSRVESISRRGSAPSNPAFVAMWFGDAEHKAEMDAVFLHAMKPAIEQAGYRATRVDLAEHNDWIMDKVIGDIRRAPFLVADFTANRNGVYFEAGFARGLGIPVIHTCKAKDLDDAHFDTRQLNHVVWNTREELLKKLHLRIVGTIGQGPYVPMQQQVGK